MTCIDCREENSDGRSIFFNAGDGPLFLSRITVQTAMIRYTEKEIVRDLNEYKSLAIGIPAS